MDRTLAEQAGDAAIEQVAANAEQDWLRATWAVVTRLCEGGVPFTSETVWLHLEEAGGTQPHERRAIGAVLREAARRGWCVAGQYVIGTRKASHGRPIRSWSPRKVAGLWDVPERLPWQP